VEHDLWRQWQAFAALSSAASTSAQGDRAAGFAPFVDAAERFTAAVRTLLDRTATASAPAAAEAARAFGDFLREQFADVQLPLRPGMGVAAARPDSVLDSPALGPTREHQQRLQRTAEAWRRIDAAQRRLQRLWSDALREAATAFVARLVPPQPAPIGPAALHRLYDEWIDCAEQAYARTAHGEAFCSAFSEFVNAGSEWRRELQASIEHWSKQFDLPTRSEINTLTRRLKTLEEQLRAAPSRPKPRVAAGGARRVRRKAKR
jgi:hypothetical protein